MICTEGHVGVGKREVRGGDERGVGGGTRRAGSQAGEVETPAMAAEALREMRQGAEGDEEGNGGDGVHDSERVGLSDATHIKPHGFTSRPPLLTTLTNKVLMTISTSLFF